MEDFQARSLFLLRSLPRDFWPRLRGVPGLGLLLGVLLLSWTRVLDRPASGYLDAALKRTLVTFA